jgi:hypothetical protein
MCASAIIAHMAVGVSGSTKFWSLLAFSRTRFAEAGELVHIVEGGYPSFVSPTIAYHIGHVTRTPTDESIATNGESDWFCSHIRHGRRSDRTADSVLVKGRNFAGCRDRGTLLLEMH